MKIISIVGARPQFVKAAPLSKELRKNFREILLHTGQHYDHNMSPIFFKELSIPKPDYNLGIGSGSHGEQTGKMLGAIEKILLKEAPDLVLVYGDTNSTLAGALAAAKLHIPIAHVEAGLRSYNRKMPEEINRVVVDHLSDLLFCPTETAVSNLKLEGITRGVFNTGDIMLDSLSSSLKAAQRQSRILEKLNLKPKTYLYATVHRPENTDNRRNLKNILDAFGGSGKTIVFPVHPRTKAAIKNLKFKIKNLPNVKFIDPVGYLDSLQLQVNAKKVLTDSGGIQKEAYVLKVPCITLRTETEWKETVKDGWNVVVGASKEKISDSIKNFSPKGKQNNYFGTGDSVSKIVKIISNY